MFWTGSVVADNPFYVPFAHGDTHVNDAGGNRNTNNAQRSSGFTHWLVPSILKKSSLFIQVDTLNTPFKVYLGEDGPTPDGVFGAYPGNPTKKRLLFSVPAADDPARPNPPQFFFEGDVQMFSGHSYGYIFELDGNPTLPTSGTFSYWLNATIYFGAAGD